MNVLDDGNLYSLAIVLGTSTYFRSWYEGLRSERLVQQSN